MILKTKQTFDKMMFDRQNSGDFLNYVAMGANRELVDKLVDKLRDHKLYIVKLSEPWTEDEDTYGTMAFRQDLLCGRIVQCKNCRMAFPWCQKFRDELGGNGFCPYGAEIIEKRAACDRTDCTLCFKESHCKALAKAERELK